MKYYEPIKVKPLKPETMQRPYSGERFYAGYLSPSGRVSIAVLPKPKIAHQDKVYQAAVPKTTGYIEYDVNTVDNTATVATEYYSSSSPLGLSGVQNHHEKTQSRRYGLKGISAGGRKRVREGCYLLERKYGKRLGFYTLTCPYTDEKLVYEFNRNIAEVARRYFQKLKRYYEGCGQVWSYVSVYEYQTRRYDSDGIPVLHIHYLAPCYRGGTYQWVCEADELRAIYASACAEVVCSNVDTSAAVDSAVIRKSAVGYISKYMSKGGDICDELAQTCSSQVPSQWWSMSANVRAAIARCTVIIPDEICAYLFAGGGSMGTEVLYLTRRRYIEVYVGRDFQTGQERHIRVGMSAQLCRDGMSAMQTWDIADMPI